MRPCRTSACPLLVLQLHFRISWEGGVQEGPLTYSTHADDAQGLATKLHPQGSSHLTGRERCLRRSPAHCNLDCNASDVEHEASDCVLPFALKSPDVHTQLSLVFWQCR